MDHISDDEISVSSLVSGDGQEPLVENKQEEAPVYDSDDDEFVPPPPPPPQDDEEYEDDEESVASNDNIVDEVGSDNDDDFAPNIENYNSDYSDEEDDDEEDYLQKLENINKKNMIKEHHPELLHHNHFEIEALTRVVRNEQGIIIDPLHKTLPFITKYERARILGERAKQINMGAKPLIEIGPDVIDGYLIAEKEFTQKKIPFIIKRPMPNGGCEYWKFKDLEAI